MSFDITSHPAVPYYEFSVNEGTSGSVYGLSFSKPLGFDAVTINPSDYETLLAAVKDWLMTLDGVTSVKAVLVDHSTTDVTPS